MMESLKVSEMWEALQKANRLPKTDTLSGAETELHELMRQIDIMVQMRKREWERDKHSMMGRLEAREQEYKITKATLEQKHQEIGQLRSQVEIAEKSQQEAAEVYEKQLGTLREEVSTMKKEYERLHRKYSKQTKDAQRDKTRISSTVEEGNAEIKRLGAKLEEYRKRAKDWDQRRREYEKQVEDLSQQKRELEEKCRTVKQQTTSYQSQLSEKQDLLDSAELSLKQQVAHLENQVDRARETIATQDSQNLRLKRSLDDAIAAQRVLLEGREKLEDDILGKTETIKTLQQEVRNSREEVERLRTRQQALKDETKLGIEIRTLEENLHKKDVIIEELQTKSVKGHIGQIRKLESDLIAAKFELEKCQGEEKAARLEIQALKQKLDQTCQEKSKLNTELTNKINDIGNAEKENVSSIRAELSKILSDTRVREESHRGEIEGMKREMSAVTKELHERNVAMATMSEKMAALERQSREHNELLERKDIEIQVAKAQLDALKSENQQLRHTAIQGNHGNGSSGAQNTTNESEIQELQKVYSSSVQTLEKQNARLLADISLLKSQLETLEETSQGRLERALAESQRTITTLQAQEERRVSEIHETSKRRVQFLEDKLAVTSEHYEAQLESLQLELTQMEDELDQQNRSMKRLGMEHQVMSQFVDGVDRMVQSPVQLGSHDNSHHSNHSNAKYPGNHSNSTGNEISLNIDEDMEDDFLTDTAEAATAKFLRDQEERTRDLEEQLDAHIQYLRTKTDGTMKKYIVRQ